MPGGALTANTQMLRDNKLMDKYPEVIAAMGEAVKKGGFGTSVTPVSQFYFQQAFNNVMFGPWAKIADGYGKMVLGYFGRTPVPPDAEVVRIASEQLKLPPTTDHLTAIENDPKRGLAATKAVLEKEHLPVTDENLFIVASCEEKGVAFLKGQGTLGVRKNQSKVETVPAPKPATSTTTDGPAAYNVALNGRNYRVVLDGKNALVNGTSYDVEVAAAKAEAVTAHEEGTSKGQPLVTQLPGLVLRVEKQVGSPVKIGDTVVVIESMKMDNAIVSSANGTIAAIYVKQGDQVQADQEMALIR
jgi:pyruvate carboxylase subunit B